MSSGVHAGIFSSWFRRTRKMLATGNGARVPCGKCRGCCTSSYFIPIGPEEQQTLGRIPKKYLSPAPLFPKGTMLLGYDNNGRCPMLERGICSIYKHRPLTCRNYDCRIFAAAGIAAEDDGKGLINKQIEQWEFDYKSKNDRVQHSAVQAAASFMVGHADLFPGGKIPKKAFQLAILAIKVSDVFLNYNDRYSKNRRVFSNKDVAKAVIEANEQFGCD